MDSKMSWKVIHEERVGDVLVKLNKLDLFRPQYSTQVLFVKKDGRRTEHLPLLMEGQGQVYVMKIAGDLHDAMRKCEQMAEADAQHQEDMRIQNLIHRETRAINHGKPQVRHTGKTERERQKRRGE